jgi:hypothetical protein
MRIEAAQAIYNCAIRDKTILSKERTKKMEVCLKDPDLKFQALITKTLCLVDNDNIDYPSLFYSYLSQLE